MENELIELQNLSEDFPRVSMTEKVGHGKSSMAGASFNFINSIIGAGIIGIPYALRECGFFVGLFMLFYVACLTDYGVRIMINAGIKTNRLSFELVTEHALGRPGFYLVSFFMFTFAYGALLAYFVVIGDSVPVVLERMVGASSLWVSRPFVMVVFGFVLILPLCMLKDMSSLSFSSSLSVVSVLVIVVVILVRAPAVAAENDISLATDPVGLKLIDKNFFGGLGAMSFAYVCHHSAFIVFNSLHDATPARWGRITKFSVGTAFTASMLLGVGGYLSFLSQTQGDVLNNFAIDDDAANVARMLLSLTMVFTFPMEQLVARHSLHSMIWGEVPITNTRHICLTLLIYGSAMVFGLIFTDLGKVLEFTGGFSASMLGYILPAIIHLRTEGMNNLIERAKRSTDNMKAKISNICDLMLPVSLLVFGVIAMAAGTITPFL